MYGEGDGSTDQSAAGVAVVRLWINVDAHAMPLMLMSSLGIAACLCGIGLGAAIVVNVCRRRLSGANARQRLGVSNRTGISRRVCVVR